MNGEISSVLIQIAVVVLGAVLTFVTTWVAYWNKKLTAKLKMKDLSNEVNRFVQWADQANSFKLMSKEEKTQTVLEKVKLYAIENEISVTDSELQLLIEKSIQSLRSFELLGLELKLKNKLKSKEAVNEHSIEK